MRSRASSAARGAALVFALSVACARGPAGPSEAGAEAGGAPAPEVRADAGGEPASARDAEPDPARDAWRHERAEVVRGYEQRLSELEVELARERERRLARESEWLRYTQALGRLGELAAVPVAPFATEAPAGGPEGSAGATTGSPAATLPSAEPAAAREDSAAASASAGAEAAVATVVPPAAPAIDLRAREREIHLALRSLFAVEQVSGLDLLESGALAGDGTAGIGPVVLRALDPAGRPTGTLCADRLRLEGSRAARTTTLVLERGFERRGGRQVSFLGRSAPEGAPDPGGVSEASLREGERRILLPEVDPAPWIEALPELFGEPARERVADDGRWDLRALRAALNDLLRLDAAGGYYRVQGFGAVQGTVLHDVMLNQLDREGRLERRLFADRMTIREADLGIEILLEDGAQVRGVEKTAFVDGRLRIVLPRADRVAWRAAGVPGLSPPPREGGEERAGDAH